MKEKLEKLINSLKKVINSVFGPVLGSLSLSKEKRISIELSQNNIKICKVNPSGKKILKIIEEDLGFEEKINFAEHQNVYTDKIKEILQAEKLINHEATVVLPTSEVEIRNLKIPTMSEFDLTQLSKDPQYWTQFDESLDLTDKVVSFQIISSDKETQEDELILAITDKNKVEQIYNILRNSGVNPNVFEPKCFGNLNAITNSRKHYKNKSFALFEYGEKENYFIIHTPKKFLFIDNQISKEDLILVKQVEKIGDVSGPFWGEVFERILQNIQAGLSETGGITEKEGIAGYDIKDILVHTEMSASENFMKGIQDKIPNLNLKSIKFLPPQLESDFVTENIFESDIYKFDKKLKKEFLEYEPISKDYFALVGSAIRFLNPFKVKEPLPIFYRLNLHHLFHSVISNRKVKSANYTTNLVLLLLIAIFSSVTAITFPTYQEKAQTLFAYKQVKNEYDTLLKQIGSASKKNKKIENEQALIKKILNNKDQFSDLIVDTPNFVPDGVQIKKVEYKQNDYAIFDGQAISDIDLNIFLENLRNNLGTPDINNISIEIIEKEKPQSTPTVVARRGINPITGNTDAAPQTSEKDILMELKKFQVRVKLNG